MQTNNEKASLKRRLFAVLNQRCLTAWRGDIVTHITNGNADTDSVNELDLGQLRYAIQMIEAGRYDWVRDGDGNFVKVDPSDTPEARNKIRRRIISKFMEMGAVDEVKGKADMPFIYATINHFWNNSFNDIDIKGLNKIAGILQNKWLPWYYDKKKEDSSFTIKDIGVYGTEKR